MSGRGRIFAWRCVLRDQDDNVVLTTAEFATLSAFALFVDGETLECEVGARRIGRRAGLHERTVRTAVRSLQEKGWLVVVARQGRTPRTRLCVPEGLDPGWEARSNPGQETRGAGADPGQDARAPRVPDPETPGGGPDERAVGSEAAAARAHARAAEPPEFSLLLHDTGVAAGPRAELLAAWEVEPERVAACVAEWWRRRERNVTTGPGLLVHMIRSGDDPRLGVRRPRRPSGPRCPECDVAEGLGHAEDCSLAGVAA